MIFEPNARVLKLEAEQRSQLQMICPFGSDNMHGRDECARARGSAEHYASSRRQSRQFDAKVMFPCRVAVSHRLADSRKWTARMRRLLINTRALRNRGGGNHASHPV